MVRYKDTTKTNAPKKLRNSKLIFPAVALLLLVTVVALELTNVSHIFHAKKAVSGPIPSTPSSSVSDEGSATQTSGTPSTNTDKPTNIDKANTPNTVNGALVAPYGTFISNHAPSLSNTPSAPSSEASVCITNPGATCTITLTMDGVTKTLNAQITDSKGAAYWNWDIVTAGLTKGDWTVTATATANGQSKSTTDSLKLRVTS